MIRDHPCSSRAERSASACTCACAAFTAATQIGLWENGVPYPTALVAGAEADVRAVVGRPRGDNRSDGGQKRGAPGAGNAPLRALVAAHGLRETVCTIPWDGNVVADREKLIEVFVVLHGVLLRCKTEVL
ncbi:hypothetical protein B0H14DRAFT_3476401 [Mycena olivaceomarginata]|nr:hypothetical protein B0H14DRAFT_3476401 [Mycena olivaceomarginata]